MNVLVTGSSRGIGKAIARKFLVAGHNVTINGNKDIESYNATMDEFAEFGEKLSGCIADMSDYEAVVSLFEIIGTVDLLVNNAAISYYGLFNTMTPADWRNIVEQNLYSVYNCTHCALPGMIQQKNGSIINISSVWGESGVSCEAVYSSVKGAVNAFTRSLAVELGPSGVRVNAVACGLIDTSMNKRFTFEELSPIIDEIPMCRIGTPDDIAEAVYALYALPYMTGQIISIDGGWKL
jgi:3-oxoacyl-[acyl-carrier protein] reductase